VGREINPAIYTREEFIKRAREKHHFITEVIRGPKIWLVGNEDDLGNLGVPL